MTNDNVINKVLYDVNQRSDTTPAEKKQARQNIGFYTHKTYVNSYDYPDCMHVRTPGANTSVIVYYPYEDRKKVQFVDGRVYTLKIVTSGIQPEDPTVETITARLFTLDTNAQRKYLCPPYTFKAGNSAQFDLNWEASGVYSISQALLDECAPHIEFNCILKNGEDIVIYCNGLEWFLNEYAAET